MGKLNWGMRACGLFLLWAAMAVALPAQTTAVSPATPTFTTLHSFDFTDGKEPSATLVQGTNGNLYGTTLFGGPFGGTCPQQFGCGTVFTITPSGALTSIYSFCSQSGCPDGANPYTTLVQATNGDFYGTTSQGGGNNACPFGCGTVFKISPSGTLTTIYSFCSQIGCKDGANPMAGLIQATDGDFYGTTYVGARHIAGTIFKITPSGTLTTLYSFCPQRGCKDGANPMAALVQATNGDFYGTTSQGGANNGPGPGTVFKITPKGALTTLYSFWSHSQGDNCPDGANPYAALVQATNGDFYGTTSQGGTNGPGSGTVFKITPGGTLTTLYSFCEQSNCTDGSQPLAALVQAANGHLYGTASSGGANGNGTVFKITPSGTLTTQFSFPRDGTDGYEPQAGLVQDANGKFYGTAGGGGANNYGTVFSLSVGLGPFVKTLPTAGKVGASVDILGTSLAGATSVTFNGTAATFTVKSKTEITTTVPTGATTGRVQVVTPGGTLSSNVPFRVK
jgi:uncharacterized repeat protein (TIGR03803 family)